MGNPKGNFKRNLILVLAAAVFWGLGIGCWQSFRFNDGRLHLIFCDVGQGDAIYLKTPNGQEVLIDGGPDEKVLDCLSSNRPFYDRKIEVLILTHPDEDHLTGLISVLERYEVDYLITENTYNDSATFAQFRKVAIQEGMRIYNPKAGDKIRLGETEINFYWPKNVVGEEKLWLEEASSDLRVLAASSTASNLNDSSLVFGIKYKDFATLQTGDAESHILKQAITASLSPVVLKVPHHGSKETLIKEILNILNPKLAVISVGKGNRFGHPAKETLELLQERGIKILRTDEEGTIEFVSDGRTWFLE